MRRSFPFALLLLASSFPAAAEPRQFGNLVYDVPPGWSVGAAEDGVQYLLSDLPDGRCRFCRILLGPALPGRADPKGALPQGKVRLLGPEAEARAEELLPPRHVQLGDGRGAAIVALKEGGWLHIVLTVPLSDRIQLLAFKGRADDADVVKESLDDFFTHAYPLFDSIAYVSEGAASLLPPAQPGPLSGLWWAWTQDAVFQIEGTISIDVDMHTLVFWPDGHFYDGTPPEGLRPLDRAMLIAAGNTEFGTYTVRGKSLHLTYATGETATLDKTRGGWRDSDREYFRAEALPDGTPLSGTISSRFAVGFGGGAGSVGGISAPWSTTFHPDGTYEGSSYGGGFGNFSDGFGNLTGGFATGAEGAEGGRYEVRDGLLIRYPSDGSAPARTLVYRTGDDIMVGQYELKP